MLYMYIFQHRHKKNSSSLVIFSKNAIFDTNFDTKILIFSMIYIIINPELKSFGKMQDFDE